MRRLHCPITPRLKTVQRCNRWHRRSSSRSDQPTLWRAARMLSWPAWRSKLSAQVRNRAKTPGAQTAGAAKFGRAERGQCSDQMGDGGLRCGTGCHPQGHVVDAGVAGTFAIGVARYRDGAVLPRVVAVHPGYMERRGGDRQMHTFPRREIVQVDHAFRHIDRHHACRRWHCGACEG